MSISLLITEALHARRQATISLWRQLVQATYLRFSSSKLDPWEYFFFQVYLDRYSLDDKKCFVGWRREILLDRSANSDTARNLANDKLSFHALLNENGFPLAEILAVYGNVTSKKADAPVIKEPAELAKFLRQTERYPLFIKPVRGGQGKNTRALLGISTDTLKLPSEKALALTDFIDALDPARWSGILLQEFLQPSPRTAAICGKRLTSVRLIVIVTSSGPCILSAVWRVATGSNITDNFNCGRNGNIIAGVKVASGHVQRVVQGIGWKNLLIDRHPDTNILFGNFCLPDWQKICTLCTEAAALLPGLRLQHWDIALTDRGPVILEVNVEGGMRTHQIVQQRGIYSPRLQEACKPE